MKDNRVSRTTSILRYVLSFTLLIAISRVATADEPDACNYSIIEKAFKEYVADTSIDQSQVETIQQQLNDGGYGKVAQDGVLGPKTRQALQRFCQTFAVKESDEIAIHLVALLDINTIVIAKYPDWRQTIVSDEFKRWLDGQPIEHQALIRQAVAAGPAEQIVAALDEFLQPAIAADKAAGAVLAPKSDTETNSNSGEKPATVLADGPSVYYQWQGVQEKPKDEIKAAIVERLNAIEGITYPNRAIFLKALAKVFNGGDIKFQSEQAWILAQAQHGPVQTLQQIKLSGSECGCSRDFASVVYGFYPYWQATGDVQNIDFSLYDRLALYALSLDKMGAIPNPLQWSDDWNAAAFINKAHKYRVDVDVAIYATEWQQWNDETVANAVRSTAAVAKQKFSTVSADSLADMLSTFGDPSSVQGDGVTVIFNGYTESPESSSKIINFITELSHKLNPALDPDGPQLNIMLGVDMDFLKQNLDQAPNHIKLFEQLSDIMLKGDNERAMVDYLFVVLQEPTTKSKKILRQEIDDEFQDRGKDRKELLRKIVPVLSSNGHDKEPRGPYIQFKDDLIYFQNNFAGVALWPMPLESEESAAMIKKMIIGEYTDNSTSSLIEELYTSISSSAGQGGDSNDIYATSLCSFACPNRRWFRVGFDLLVAALLLYAVLSVWISRLRDLTKRYFWAPIVAVLVTVAVFVVSLVCDPYWQQRADAVVISILLAGILYSLFKFISKITQPPLP